MLYQQGDVLIKKIEKLPSNAIEVERKNGKLILAEGEATGHAHSIAALGAMLLKDNGAMFLRANEVVALQHQEHNTISIEPGVYKIDIVREYDHFAEEARKVRD